MTRYTWKKGNLRISYGHPSITAHSDIHDNEREVFSMEKDMMYFYYKVDILSGRKVALSYSVYDFPKVHLLPEYIDYIMNFDMTNSFIVENTINGDFHRKIKYAHIQLEDGFGFDIEYFYKIERYDYMVKQNEEDEYNYWTEYHLTIGGMEPDKKYGGANREDYGKVMLVKNITPAELTELKMTALKFCDAAMNQHNKLLEIYKSTLENEDEED